MRNTIFVAALAVVAMATALQCKEATAQGPFLGGGYGYGSYSIYSTESIPFYWRYSPVYYSIPIPRTYGYSPYAYPPGVRTPEVIIEPEVTVNPYVPKEQTPADPSSRVAGGVKRIQNPFVAVSTSGVAGEDADDNAADELTMLLDNWHKMPAEVKSEIVKLIQSAQ